jgi:integrase
MAEIKKITYKKKKDGKVSTYWQVTYYDAAHKRHRKNFDRNKRATAYRIKVENELLLGTHLPDNESVTVETAADNFIAHFEKLTASGRRERSSLRQYKSHVKNHIKPSKIKGVLLSKLQAKQCSDFLNELTDKAVSDIQAAKIMVTFRAILRHSEVEGWIKGNPAKAVIVKKDDRQKKWVKIPDRETILRVLKEAEKIGAWQYAFVHLGFFCGLRASELRGLSKENIKFGKTSCIEIVQRADEFGTIGPPKTEKSRRTIQMGEKTAKVVKAWVDIAPHDLIFANKEGKPSNHANLWNRFLMPLKKSCGITGKFGFHVMRHVCASLWIAKKYSPKQLQELMGHATLAITMDLYGHLWKDEEETQKFADAVENSIFGINEAVV